VNPTPWAPACSPSSLWGMWVGTVLMTAEDEAQWVWGGHGAAQRWNRTPHDEEYGNRELYAPLAFHSLYFLSFRRLPSSTSLENVEFLPSEPKPTQSFPTLSAPSTPTKMKSGSLLHCYLLRRRRFRLNKRRWPPLSMRRWHKNPGRHLLVPYRPMGPGRRYRVVCRTRKWRHCCILGGSTLPVHLDPFLFNCIYSTLFPRSSIPWPTWYHALPTQMGAPTAKECGPVICFRLVSSIKHRNAIGAHSSSYSIYRALFIAMGALSATYKPNYSNSEPPISIPPNPASG